MEKKEYIEREALIKKIKEKANTLRLLRSLYTDQSARALDGLAEEIAEIPTADVAEIKPLSVEELKTLPLREWVWIEALEPFDYEEKVSAYYRKQMDYTHDKAFCCGYPGLSFSFYYEDYGKTWTAFTCKPKESDG